MPEPICEQIAAAVAAKLRTIIGDSGVNYWQTPTVSRFAGLDSSCMDRSKALVYVVVPDRISRQQSPAQRVNREMTLDIAGIWSHGQDGSPSEVESPFSSISHTRWTRQHRMTSDVEKCLCGGDLTLGGIAINTEVLDWELSGEQTYYSGFTVVMGRIRVTYQTARGQA